MNRNPENRQCIQCVYAVHRHTPGAAQLKAPLECRYQSPDPANGFPVVEDTDWCRHFTDTATMTVGGVPIGGLPINTKGH